MCGIFGWDLTQQPAAAKGWQRSAMAAALMIANDNRGGDSWGYYSPEWSDVAEPRRGLGEMAHRVRAKTLARCNRLLAHTRYATVGNVTKTNAHPFACGDVIGAHNGCVSNHNDLNRMYARACAVDSEHIFRHIDENESLETIEAYGAIEYVYRVDEAIYLARFNGGELSIAQTSAGIVWSSAREALHNALHCAGLDCQFYNVEEDRLYYARNGILYDTGMPLGFSPYRSAIKWSSFREMKDYEEEREMDSLLGWNNL